MSKDKKQVMISQMDMQDSTIPWIKSYFWYLQNTLWKQLLCESLKEQQLKQIPMSLKHAGNAQDSYLLLT